MSVFWLMLGMQLASAYLALPRGYSTNIYGRPVGRDIVIGLGIVITAPVAGRIAHIQGCCDGYESWLSPEY
jgi:hypothetical protein